MVQKMFVFIVSLFFAVAVHSQSSAMEKVKSHITNLFDRDSLHNSMYYDDFSDQLTIRVFTQNKNNQIELRNKLAGQTYDYLPNARNAIGVGFQYKTIGMNLSFSPAFSKEKIEQFGDTKSFDFQTSIYQYDKGFDIGFQSYEGYYLENTVANIPNWEDSSKVYILPGLNVMNVNLSSFFILRPSKFSYRPVFLQNGWQKKTGGSIIWGPYMVYTRMQNDSSIIPLVSQSNFENDGIIRSNIYFALGARIGYGINVVIFKHLFMHTTILLGIDRYMNRIVLRDQLRGYTRVGFGTSSMFRLGLGWANKKYTIGIYSVIHGFQQEIAGQTSMVSTLNQARFVIARRF